MASDMRRCSVCDLRTESRNLHIRKVEGTRKKFCQKCLPGNVKTHMGSKSNNLIEDLEREEVKKSMKLAVLRGLKSDIFNEEEALRVLEQMV